MTPLSLYIASSGMDNASGTRSVSIALPVVIPGRSVVSDWLTVICTSNTLASVLGRCSPTLATLATVPVSRLPGSASRVSATGWPTATRRTSISFT